jgi:hypothetical protein
MSIIHGTSPLEVPEVGVAVAAVVVVACVEVALTQVLQVGLAPAPHVTVEKVDCAGHSKIDAREKEELLTAEAAQDLILTAEVKVAAPNAASVGLHLTPSSAISGFQAALIGVQDDCGQCHLLKEVDPCEEKVHPMISLASDYQPIADPALLNLG